MNKSAKSHNEAISEFWELPKVQRKALTKSRKDFAAWVNQEFVIREEEQEKAFLPDLGLRITSFPKEKINSQKRALDFVTERFVPSSLMYFDGKPCDVGIDVTIGDVQPCLRGAIFEKTGIGQHLELRILDNGLIEFRWKYFDKWASPQTSKQKEVKFYETSALGLLYGVYKEIQKFREANKSNVNYLLEYEIVSPAAEFVFIKFNDRGYGGYRFRFHKDWLSPLYEVPTNESTEAFLNQFHRDLYDSAGWRRKPNLTLESSKEN